VAYMVGPALGGALVAANGTKAALFVNVGVLAVMTLTVATATGLPLGVAERAPAAGRLRDAVAHARRDPTVRRLLGLQAVGMFFFTLSIPVEVVLARHTLHASATGYGVLLAVWGAGTIVGSGFYARWRGLSSRLLITVGTVLLGAGFLILAVAPTIGVAFAGSATAGIGNGVQVVAMRIALQEAVSEERMAMILSLNESMFQAVPGVGILVGGAITALAGPRAALAIAAAGSLVVASLMWLKLSGVGEAPIQLAADADVPGPEPVLTPPVGQN
jgi:predicted MFS family arabinose efflux permease